MVSGDEVVQVVATARDAASADALVAALLEGRLIACGQRLGPIQSQYRRRGELESAEEWLVVCKTTSARADAVVAAIVEAHPDDVPEVLVVPVLGGHPGYLAWVATSLEGDGGG